MQLRRQKGADPRCAGAIRNTSHDPQPIPLGTPLTPVSTADDALAGDSESGADGGTRTRTPWGCRFSYHFDFRRRPQAFVVWTIPSPSLDANRGLGAARLVSTPSPERGLARDWPRLAPLAFPDFERFYAEDFPPGTPIEVCCVYRFRHVRNLSRSLLMPQRRRPRESEPDYMRLPPFDLLQRLGDVQSPPEQRITGFWGTKRAVGR